jgi:hypothetical protein
MITVRQSRSDKPKAPHLSPFLSTVDRENSNTMIMFSWKAPIVLTVSLLWLAASVPCVHAKQSDFAAMYRIVPRGSNRRMQDDEDAIISFDGDLDRIQQLALEEAIKKKNAAGISVSPSLSPTPSTMDRYVGISDAPSLVPTVAPSASLVPSLAPSESSMIPSSAPSRSDMPSTAPSMVPSGAPSHSTMPSDTPSIVPSSAPSHSSMPSDAPSIVPSQQPSASAPSTAGSTTPAPTPDPLDSTTIITCPDVEGSDEYIVTWQYSVETVPNFPAQLIVDRVEKRLANEMVPLLLNCWDPSVFFDFNLQALDQQPRDTPSESGTLHYVCFG